MLVIEDLWFHLWVEGHPRAYAASARHMHAKKARTFLSRVTLGHMQPKARHMHSKKVTLGHMQLRHGICIRKKLELFCRGSPSGICSYARHMHTSVLALRATNLKFETRYPKLATNLEFGIQICLVPKLFCAHVQAGTTQIPTLLQNCCPGQLAWLPWGLLVVCWFLWL